MQPPLHDALPHATRAMAPLDGMTAGYARAGAGLPTCQGSRVLLRPVTVVE